MALCELLENISYQFKDTLLLEEALTHPSFNKQALENNYQRLEFLGDAVLSMVIAEILLKKYYEENEGHLSKRQARLVSGDIITMVAEQINLGKFIRMSPGEEYLGGRTNKRNLENSLEALIGAIYLDSNIENCQKFINKYWQKFINEDITPPQDPISQLQEVVQSRTKKLPKYQTNRTGGDDHTPIFVSIVEIDGIKYSASGNSKKDAQKKAAIFALDAMHKKLPVCPL